jgi:hypothetical protein
MVCQAFFIIFFSFLSKKEKKLDTVLRFRVYNKFMEIRKRCTYDIQAAGKGCGLAAICPIQEALDAKERR